MIMYLLTIGVGIIRRLESCTIQVAKYILFSKNILHKAVFSTTSNKETRSKNFKHSDDYQSIYYKGKEFTLANIHQAKAMEILHKEWKDQ